MLGKPLKWLNYISSAKMSGSKLLHTWKRLTANACLQLLLLRAAQAVIGFTFSFNAM